MSGITRREIAHFAAGTAALAAVLPAPAIAAADWRLGFKTAPEVLDSELTLLMGRVPTELQGVFYRVGPAQFERGGERLGHWFDGDGMVQSFAIADGRVRHRGRFVATDKRRGEQAVGRFIYSGYGFGPKSSAELRQLDDLNAANTNILPIAGELWALWEGGSPWRLDAATLETIGRKRFEGPLDGAPFSAHPKCGPDGDVWNFGVLGQRCVIWQLSADANVRRTRLVELPAASLMHDFAVTARHLVLLLPPMHADAGGEPKSLVDRYQWHANRPLQVLVLDKSDLTIKRSFELPARFLFHVSNAWEDNDGTIRLDAFLDSDATFASRTARDLALGRANPSPTALLTNITLSASGSARLEAFHGTGEFPRMNPRHVGLKHRFTYGVVANGVARWDLTNGARDAFDYGPNTWSEEPVFIPRGPARSEGDGWLVATVLNYGASRTELAIFDARSISDGPVARLACPYALPLGFHGAFVTG